MKPCLPAGDGTSCLLGLLLDRPGQGTGDVECSGCGCPAPPIIAAEGLPRLERDPTAQAGRWKCVLCGGPLRRGRRKYCGPRCERSRLHRALSESPQAGS
jgi:hypothetical protein